MIGISSVSAVLLAVLVRTFFQPASHGAWANNDQSGLPAQAQRVDQRNFNVLGNVPPPTVANGQSVSHSVTRFR